MHISALETLWLYALYKYCIVLYLLYAWKVQVQWLVQLQLQVQQVMSVFPSYKILNVTY